MGAKAGEKYFHEHSSHPRVTAIFINILYSETTGEITSRTNRNWFITKTNDRSIKSRHVFVEQSF